MIDEMADAFGVDPVQYRMMHMTQLIPGDTRYPYETMPTVEVLQEGSKAFGWEKRNPRPWRQSGKIQAWIRPWHVPASWRGNMGYHEGEEAFAKLAAMPWGEHFLAATLT